MANDEASTEALTQAESILRLEQQKSSDGVSAGFLDGVATQDHAIPSRPEASYHVSDGQTPMELAGPSHKLPNKEGEAGDSSVQASEAAETLRFPVSNAALNPLGGTPRVTNIWRASPSLSRDVRARHTWYPGVSDESDPSMRDAALEEMSNFVFPMQAKWGDPYGLRRRPDPYHGPNSTHMVGLRCNLRTFPNSQATFEMSQGHFLDVPFLTITYHDDPEHLDAPIRKNKKHAVAMLDVLGRISFDSSIPISFDLGTKFHVITAVVTTETAHLRYHWMTGQGGSALYRTRKITTTNMPLPQVRRAAREWVRLTERKNAHWFTKIFYTVERVDPPEAELSRFEEEEMSSDEEGFEGDSEESDDDESVIG